MLLDLVLPQGCFQLGQRMARRHREQPLHLPQLRPLKIRHSLGLVRRAHDQVGPAFTQRFPGAAQHLVRQAQADPGRQLVELVDQGRHQLEFQDLVADDMQPVFPTAGHLFDALRQP
ncbi:hypothetical protein D3C86_1775230 [compost metagenome]